MYKLNVSTKKYIREVRVNLKCSRKSRKKCLLNLQQAICDLPNPEKCTYDYCTEQFGQPASVAAEYYSVLTPKELRHFTGKSKIILGLVVLLAVVIAISLAYFFWVRTIPTGVIKETGKFEMPDSNEIIATETYKGEII